MYLRCQTRNGSDCRHVHSQKRGDAGSRMAQKPQHRAYFVIAKGVLILRTRKTPRIESSVSRDDTAFICQVEELVCAGFSCVPRELAPEGTMPH